MGETWQLSSISASLLASRAERMCLEVMKSVLMTSDLHVHSISFCPPLESLFLSVEFDINSAILNTLATYSGACETGFCLRLTDNCFPAVLTSLRE